MARTPSQELERIQSELRSIIAQIRIASDELKSNQGIGIEKCTQTLDDAIRDYKNLLSKLEIIKLDAENAGSGTSGGAGSSRSF